MNAADAAGTPAAINNEEDFENGSWTGTAFAKYPGTLGNSLQVVVAGSTTWSGWDAAYKAQFDAAPTGTERHVLVLDEDGVITGTAGSVLERFPFVSSSSTAQNADGSSNYEKDVINNQSNYVWVNGALDSDADLSLTGGTDNTSPTILSSINCSNLATAP